MKCSSLVASNIVQIHVICPFTRGLRAGTIKVNRVAIPARRELKRICMPDAHITLVIRIPDRLDVVIDIDVHIWHISVVGEVEVGKVPIVRARVCLAPVAADRLAHLEERITVHRGRLQPEVGVVTWGNCRSLYLGVVNHPWRDSTAFKPAVRYEA